MRIMWIHVCTMVLLSVGGCHSVSTADPAPVVTWPSPETPAEETSQPAASPVPDVALLKRLEAIVASSGTDADLQGLKLEWSDMQGLHGGKTIQVQGEGATLVLIRGPGTPKTQAGKISKERVRRLLGSLLGSEVWDTPSSVRSGVPDEVRLRVSVALGNEKLEVWRWQSDIKPGQRDPIGQARPLFEGAVSPDPDAPDASSPDC